MSIHNPVHAELLEVADRQGWNEDTQILHLSGFLQRLIDAGGEIQSLWNEYLAAAEAEENEMSEHDPDHCGCTYIGNDKWSCGHIDNLPQDSS